MRDVALLAAGEASSEAPKAAHKFKMSKYLPCHEAVFVKCN